MLFADHAIGFLLVVLLPFYGRWSWRRLQQRLARGRDDARLSAYARTIVLEWSLVVAVVLVWGGLGRPLASLGLVASLETRFLAVMTAAVLLATWLIGQARSLRGLDDERRAAIVRQLAPVSGLLPHTAGERDVFLALSFTAGFCEELLYRGFLIAYLTPAAGLWGAVTLAAAVFGLVHAYQGKAGILKTGATGLVMGVAYALSGSIWPAVVMHAALDVQGGLIAHELFAARPAACRR